MPVRPWIGELIVVYCSCVSALSMFAWSPLICASSPATMARFASNVCLLAGQVFRGQCQIALQVSLGALQLRLILRLRGARLPERRLEWPWIDLRQQVALIDHLAFLETELLQLTIHTGSHGDGVECLDG